MDGFIDLFTSYLLVALVLFLFAAMYIIYFKKDSDEEEEKVEKLSGSISEYGRNKRAKHNLDKFVENISPDVRKSTSQINAFEAVMGIVRKRYDTSEFAVKSNEVALSEDEYGFILEGFQNTNFAWLSAMALAVTDDGKLRIPFSSIQMIITKFNPVMLPDGTMKIINFLSLDESVNLTLMKDVPMFVRDTKNKVVRTFTKEMLEGRIIERSLEEILDSADSLSKYEKKLTLALDEAKDLKEEVNRKNKEMTEKDLAIIELVEKIKRLVDNEKKLINQNKELQNKNNNCHKEQQSNQNQKPSNGPQQKKQHHEKNKNSPQNKSSAITHNAIYEDQTNDNTTQPIGNCVVAIDKKNHEATESYSSKDFYKMIEEAIISDNQEILDSAGLIFIGKKYNSESDEKIIILREDKILGFKKNWEEEHNCEIKINTSVQYVFNFNSDVAVKVHSAKFFTSNEQIKTDTDDFIVPNVFVDQIKKTQEGTVLNMLISANKISEIGKRK